MKLRNPIMFILFLIFLLVNAIDLITAYYILPGESNPLYLLTGSMSFLSVFKVFFVMVVLVLYLYNTFTSHFNYFSYIIIIVLGIFLIGLGAYSNILGMQNPELVEEAAKIPKEEKQKMYITLVSIVYIIPLGLSLLAFKLYEKSVKNINIRKPKKTWPWKKRWQ